MNRLKGLRLEHELTLKDIQEQIGIKRSTYGDYENGKSEPKLATWELLADYFDVDPEYLVGWSDIKRKNA
ncbi:helix-turn-helix domain-containing protein [Leuconostoc lactis]|uniref:helix-turn-helix domain-containing protein n=1 Tax=Leuconostoc lactis TaxID=1246 RepID=UPI0021A8CCBA|nr:helix-turn-helix transcriptional regulator [Leuconostoc lactis]MCT3115388.1 XRE family transcriptional regulator [Leuconostoc lactis]